VAVKESSYHAGRYLRAAGLLYPTIIPRVAFQLTLDASGHLDIRQGGIDDPHESSLYDPISYAASQAFGAQARANGRDGIWYDSVRSPSRTFYATFKPAAVQK
jgi:hypothetical protein